MPVIERRYMGMEDHGYLRTLEDEGEQFGHHPVATACFCICVILVSGLWWLAAHNFFQGPSNYWELIINPGYYAENLAESAQYREKIITHFTLDRSSLDAGRWHCLGTYVLFHPYLSGLLFHCLFLAALGAPLERLWGAGKTSLLLLLAVVGAAGCYLAAIMGYPTVPALLSRLMSCDGPACGLSGTVAALAAANLIYRPRRKLWLVPMWAIGALFFLFELTGLLSFHGDPVPYALLLGGGAVGLVFGFICWARLVWRLKRRRAVYRLATR